jgi:hypothetical protein
MKKLLCLLIISFFSSLSAISADMRFIQVESLLYKSESKQNFEKLIEKINDEKNVEFVVFTGNNIAKPDENLLKEFLSCAKKIKAPYYIVLGQKDVNKNKKLGKEDYIKVVRKKNFTMRNVLFPNYVFKKKNMVFIIADGSKEFIPTPIGYYREDVLLWLDDQLDKYSDKNVVILQHYPIIPPIQKETHYTYKADDYLQLLSEHKNVKAVIAGHFNVNGEKEVNGILHVSTKNAPTYRVVDILDYETENPTFWSIIKD